MATKAARLTPDSFLCPECDYNLTGAPGDRCPWCGWEIDQEQLIDPSKPRLFTRHIPFFAASLALGLSCIYLVITLVLSARSLSVFDGITAVGVLIGGVGLVCLACKTMANRKVWPLRDYAFGTTLSVVGCVSVAISVIGALPAWQLQTGPRGVQGVMVHGAMEFFVLAFFLAFPGWMLLLLSIITFNYPTRRKKEMAGDGESEIDPESLAPFRVDVVGYFEREQVITDWNPQRRPTTPAIEAAIARIWETEAALALTDGSTLYNGTVGRLVSAELVENSLKLTLGVTSYRDFLGTNAHNLTFVLRQNPDALANPLGVSTLVITQDGYLMLGRRSSNVHLHQGFLQPFGGLLETADRMDPAGYDPFASARRELEEELTVKRDEIERMVIVGLVRDRSLYQPELLFEAQVALTRDEILSRFSSTLSGGEHEAMESVPDEPQAMLPFLDASEPVTPVGQAILLLHGWHRWGKPWYEEAHLNLYGEQPLSPVVESYAESKP